MNDNDLERALRTQRGPREDGYQPATLPMTPGDGDAATNRGGLPRIGLLIGVGAAGALAVAVVAALLSGGGGALDVGSGGSSASAQPTSRSPQPTTTPPQLAPCKAEDFAWSTDPWMGAAGSRGTTVLLRGVASLEGCRVDGAVSIEIRDADEQELVGNETISNIRVLAGDVLEIGIAWSNWCGTDPAQPLSAVLRLPGDGTEVPLMSTGGEILVPPCNGESQPSNLSITDIQPSSRAFPEG
jgi:hypothetical protein